MISKRPKKLFCKKAFREKFLKSFLHRKKHPVIFYRYCNLNFTGFSKRSSTIIDKIFETNSNFQMK